MSNKDIMIVANNAWNLVHFRSELISAIIEAGFNLTTILSKDDDAAGLDSLGVNIIRTPFSFRSRNSFIQILLFFHVLWLINFRRPNIILTFTLVPNIYCSIAGWPLKIPVINNVTGFGSAFTKSGLEAKIIRSLVKFAFYRSKRVFVQNKTDMDELISLKICAIEQLQIIPGSGINVKKILPSKMQGSSNFTFLMAARLIQDKGVVEYLEAAKLVEQQYPDVRFKLYGDLDHSNLSAMSETEFQRLLSLTKVKHFPFTDDILTEMAACHCVVLPSYREGLSRFLLEGAALGKAIIASDVPGCRELVIEGKNGFLCKHGDPESLAKVMMNMCALSRKEVIHFGECSRVIVEENFKVEIVLERYMEQIFLFDT